MAFTYTATYCPDCGVHYPHEACNYKKDRKILGIADAKKEDKRLAADIPLDLSDSMVEETTAEQPGACARLLCQKRILTLMSQNGAMQQQELQKIQGLLPQSSEEPINNMENTGFLTRGGDKKRGRESIELTTGGLNAACRLGNGVTPEISRLFACLSDTEKAQL